MIRSDERTPWGGTIWHLDQTTSTMDEALLLEERGEPSGSLVSAKFQHAGVGRHTGRRWVSGEGESLLFTVFWHPSVFASPEFAPSLTVGAGVCAWLQSLPLAAGYPVALKWPNDVLLGGRKVAGILVKRRLGHPGTFHAGLGVNLQQTGFEGAYHTPPVSLRQAGVSLTSAQALSSLLPHLQRALSDPEPRALCQQLLWQPGELDPTGRLIENP